MLHEDRDRASSFGDDALQYDRSRPSYPPELIDDLVTPDTHRVADIGCGTGIVSRLFAARGCTVLGVEADARMAEVARTHGLTVDVSPFERWDAPDEPFDLAVAGQAWHWIDPAGGAAKAATVLRPAGRFAAFWNSYALVPGDAAMLLEVYRRQAPALVERTMSLGRLTADELVLSGIDGSDRFSPVEARTYHWTHTYDRDAWLDQVQTHSDHRMMDDADRRPLLDALRAAIDELGGRVEVDHTTRMLTATRLP